MLLSAPIVTAYLGLGANEGDREAAIGAALRGLHQPPEIVVTRRSSLYETVPVGVTNQPDFLNAVAEVRTALPPRELLARVLHLERQMGRVRTQRWGPRVIDVDILLYGDLVLIGPQLIIPHPRITERAFVLQPLAEVAPDALFPDGETVQKKLQSLTESGNNTGVRLV